MKPVAYLINQYPKVSHSFIRREITALEACGISIARFAIRSEPETLVDKDDLREQCQTRAVLGEGLIGLLKASLGVVLRRPLRFLEALQLTLKIGWNSDRGLLRHFAYLAEACVLLNWFAEQGIGHVHAHFGTNSTTVAMLCHTLGGPMYSFTVHGPEEFDKVTAISLSEKIKQAAFVVAISSFGKSQLYRWSAPEQWSKIHVVRCGVDRDFLDQPVSMAHQPRLVCVGRLCEQKGQLLLLKAASQLAAKGFHFKLVLVGDGPLRSDLEGEIGVLGLQDHVEITGWANNSDVRHQILQARALVLPSFAEGLPVVIMEALALGRPVISTYVAGIPELVEVGINGWLVPPGTLEPLVDAMQAVLESNVEALEAMGQVGAAKVAQLHSASIEAQKLATLFQENVEILRQPELTRASLDFPYNWPSVCQEP
jgi:colanic acid/amylovoran biosynthesis glycosyltransferase